MEKIRKCCHVGIAIFGSNDCHWHRWLGWGEDLEELFANQAKELQTTLQISEMFERNFFRRDAFDGMLGFTLPNTFWPALAPDQTTREANQDPAE